MILDLEDAYRGYYVQRLKISAKIARQASACLTIRSVYSIVCNRSFTSVNSLISSLAGDAPE